MGILCKHKFEGGSSLHEWGERYTLRTQETLKHSEYYIQIFSEFLGKTRCCVLKMLTFSSAGLSFLPSPS